MNNKALIQKFRKMPWEPWLKRRFPVLVAYLMITNASRQAFAKQKIKGEWPIVLFERGMWYSTAEMFDLAGKEAGKYVKKLGTAFLVKTCLHGYREATREIAKMLKDKKTPALEQYKKIVSLLDPINVSVWTAHAAEVYFNDKLKRRLTKYIAVDKLDKYIGDVGFPKRKNAHALMVDDVLEGFGVEKLYAKYTWLKSRIDAGYDVGYTLAEMKDLRQSILDSPPTAHVYPDVPRELRSLVKEFQDIVYLRTLRTDSLFEINFLAKPIFAKLEKELGIDSVKNYLPEDFILGRLNRFDNDDFAVLKFYDDIIVTKEKITGIQTIAGQEIKGVVAWKGKAVGRVVKVLCPVEANKVKQGDILVTNMTIPAYLLAMRKAAAFVTDEGGITCHAAILAREMKKPCITGTKIATRVLQDGDIVEVDANIGTVKKI